MISQKRGLTREGGSSFYYSLNIGIIDNFSIIAERNNLVSRAIEMFDKIADIKQHFSVYIHKVTPIKGGFGGGSSNAAATLKLLNRIYKADFDDDALKLMGFTKVFDVTSAADLTTIEEANELLDRMIYKKNLPITTKHIKPHFMDSLGSDTDTFITLNRELKASVEYVIKK